MARPAKLQTGKLPESTCNGIRTTLTPGDLCPFGVLLLCKAPIEPSELRAPSFSPKPDHEVSAASQQRPFRDSHGGQCPAALGTSGSNMGEDPEEN